MHFAHPCLRGEDVVTVHDPGHRAGRAAGGLQQDVAFLGFAGIVHPHVQQETVELRFRQWIGAGLFDRVLGGQHEERFGQRMGGAGVAHRVLLHRFQQRGLGLRRGAVELVGQQQVGEHRPLLEAERALAGAVVFLQQFGAEDVAGHQVRGELHAPELQVQRLSQRAHQQGLAESRGAFQQAVAAGQQADQQLLHHLVLADHRLGDGLAQFAQARQLFLDAGFVHRLPLRHVRSGSVSCSMRTSRC